LLTKFELRSHSLKFSVPKTYTRRRVRGFSCPSNSSTIESNRNCAVAMTCSGANHALTLYVHILTCVTCWWHVTSPRNVAVLGNCTYITHKVQCVCNDDDDDDDDDEDNDTNNNFITGNPLLSDVANNTTTARTHTHTHQHDRSYGNYQLLSLSSRQFSNMSIRNTFTLYKLSHPIMIHRNTVSQSFLYCSMSHDFTAVQCLQLHDCNCCNRGAQIPCARSPGWLCTFDCTQCVRVTVYVWLYTVCTGDCVHHRHQVLSIPVLLFLRNVTEAVSFNNLPTNE
jgi:hypothetical protein